MLDTVNMVNAPLVARERDIDVSEVKHERDCDYQTLIRLTVTSERGPRSVAGTLFGGSKPRVVDIKGISVEAALTPHMLYISNEDKRSEEHTSELQSLMRNSYAVYCLKK